MITNIPNDEFIRIRKELDSLPADSEERMTLAEGYLFEYNLPDEVSNETLLRCFFGGHTSQAVWKWLYLLERSIPYYDKTQPEWQKRLLYFPATYIMEVKVLDHKKISYQGNTETLRFARDSGDHNVLHAGRGKNVADFHIWADGQNLRIDYKFASLKRFSTIEQVYTYYMDGKHMHNAKLLLSFLEAENTFYLVDYINYEY